MFSHLKTRLVTGLQTKVGIAIVGALVIGGGGTALAMTATHGNLGQLGSALTAPGSSHTEPTGTACGQGDEQATETSGQSGHTEQDATEPSGQSGEHDGDQCEQDDQTDIEGTVGNVDTGSSSFTLNTEEHGSITVKVDGNTQYSGGLTGLGSLQQGAHVRVRGARQSDGSVLASSVSAGDGEHPEGTETPEATHTPEGGETPEPTHTPEGDQTPEATGTPDK
jgi:hypothetical protein